jgi:N-acylneuraminate cytidylyltransferase/CMP-N,N'-diacetyllegionaminic acid synthase
MAEIVGLITARGGSRGIPRKNIKLLAGKPLIAWTIEAALASQCLSRVIVSTEDEEIARIAREWGAEVPFVRPAELAQDHTLGIEPVLHAMQWLDEHESYRPDYVMLLQPTSPLRTAQDIQEVIALAARLDADSVVGICQVKYHPYWTVRMNDDGTLRSFLDGPDWDSLQKMFPRRQDLPLAYAENGAIYLVRRQVLLKCKSFYGKKFYGYVMPGERSLDIDTPGDFHLVDLLLKDKMCHAGDQLR